MDDMFPPWTKYWTRYMLYPISRLSLWRSPTPHKVSQKERRKKERYLRSQGLKVKEGK